MDEFPNEDVQQLIEGCRAGSEDAVNALFMRYATRLCRLSEQHLNAQLAARIDGEDVVQSVFRSFLIRARKGAFVIENGSQLWRLLVTITLQKTRESWRRNTAGIRDATVDVPLADEEFRLLASEPQPDQAAVLVDQVQWLLSELTPWHAQVLEGRLAGETPKAIAERSGKSRAAVFRALTDLQERMQVLLETSRRE